MKRLGFRAAKLSTDTNVEARTKPSQTTEPQLFYIVCCGFVVYAPICPLYKSEIGKIKS